MRKLIIVTIALLLAPALHAASDSQMQKTAAAADESYRKGNYSSAVEQYNEVIANGFSSANLYYNLGNAYYRLDRFADAILCYERALRLNPSHSDAKQNLALANSKTQDRIATLPQFFLAAWYNALVTRITPHAWRIIVLLFLALLAASFVIFRLAHQLTLRKAAFIAIIASAALMLLSIILLLISTARFNSRDAAIVMQPSVAVKSSPESQSVDKLILHEGTRVVISEDLSGWHKITLADGTTGWLPSDAIERI